MPCNADEARYTAGAAFASPNMGWLLGIQAPKFAQGWSEAGFVLVSTTPRNAVGCPCAGTGMDAATLHFVPA